MKIKFEAPMPINFVKTNIGRCDIRELDKESLEDLKIVMCDALEDNWRRRKFGSISKSKGYHTASWFETMVNRQRLEIEFKWGFEPSCFIFLLFSMIIPIFKSNQIIYLLSIICFTLIFGIIMGSKINLFAKRGN